MPCQASHPGVTIVKSLPCGETSRHASHPEEAIVGLVSQRGEKAFVRFLGEMPRPASHPGETIFKSLPWHGAGHRQTSPRRSNAETTMFQSTRYCSLKGDKLPVAVDRHGIVLCRNEAVVHEPTVANRTDRVAVDKFLLAQKRPVAGGDEPGAFEGNPWSKTLSRDTLRQGSSLASLLP